MSNKVKLMAANWKMFKTREETRETLHDLSMKLTKIPHDRKVVIFAPFTAIAQNFYPADEGAFTGEVSLAMLKEIETDWVLVGHSERRHIFGESLELIEKKVCYAIEHGMNTVLCVGETLEEREADKLEKVLKAQLECLSKLKGYDAENFAVAYEPVWAIGTGKVAGPAEILEAHGIVREILQDRLGAKGADINILYGGSVKPENTAEIIGLDNVDGVLVGGASLQAESFAQIVQA